MLVDLKVKHHVHPVAVAPEVVHVRLRKHIRLGEDDAVATAPLQELAKDTEHIKLLLWPGNLCAFSGDNEWDRVHPKAGDAELNPETHDLENLGLDFGVGGIQVRLEIVEAMKIVSFRFLIVTPGGFLDAGKDHSLVCVW